MHFKGTKASVSNLPTTGNVQGDMWNVTDTGANYAWDGSQWDKLSENIDLSGYVPTSRTINSKALTGNISLTASDVGALPSSTSIPTITDTYSATSSDGMSGKAVASAIGSKVDANTAITGATKCKITYDSKGLVTAGADLQASDIPSLASSKTTTMTGYSKASASAAISTSDSLNTAIGKLEYKADNAVIANSSITGATKCKITYDSKGLVTAGANLAASDIPNLSLSKITDVTATAAELNVLDGITATTIELNYTDGVTSNIQTQLNAKAADSDVVKLTGDQNIAGNKTFSAEPIINSNIQFGNVETGTRGIWGKVGNNDYWRVMGGATANNAGYMELATADDGSEPIYVRQYSGNYATLQRTATLLDGSGNTSFPGNTSTVGTMTVGQHAVMSYNSTTEALEFSFV